MSKFKSINVKGADLVIAKEEYYPLDVVGWIPLIFLPNIEAELLYKDSELDCN